MEKLEQKKRIKTIQEQYLNSTIEKDLEDEIARQRAEEGIAEEKVVQKIKERTVTEKTLEQLTTEVYQRKAEEPSSLYVAAVLAGDFCKAVARIPVDYAVGFLPEAAQKKLYGERAERAFYTNIFLQPMVTGSAGYLLTEGLKDHDRIGVITLLLLAEMVNSLARDMVKDTDKKEAVGHLLTTIPYHLFRISKQEGLCFGRH